MIDTKNICAKLQAEAGDKRIFEKSLAYACDYMQNIDDRNVKPTDAALENLRHFNEPLPDDGGDTLEILRLLHDYGSPATMAQTGGRYFGFVNGGAVPASLAAKWLADVWDQNAALNVISPVAAALEDVCEGWLVDLLGLPQGTAAGFVSGSSTATLCGITAARNHLLKNKGYDVAKHGLFGAPPIRVVLGEEAHSTVFKALSVLGMGSERIEKVPTDENGNIDCAKLPQLDDNTLLILQAGNVNTGAFDNFNVLCKEANDKGAWVHVDGAFGLWAKASKQFDPLTSGISGADSWSTDAHKTLNAPYDCGIILCRNRQALLDALHMEGAYIMYSENRDNMMYTLDMSRRARGVELWATMKSLGRNGVKQLVEHLHDQAVYFAGKLQQNGFKVLNEVCFNQINVYVGDAMATQKFLAHIQNSGICWCGGSQRRGRPFVRISVCSYKTTCADIDKAANAFIQARENAL